MASFPKDITKLFRNFRTAETIVKAKLLFIFLNFCVYLVLLEWMQMRHIQTEHHLQKRVVF